MFLISVDVIPNPFRHILSVANICGFFCPASSGTVLNTCWSQGYNRLVKRVGLCFQESLDWGYLLLESLEDLTYKTFRFQFLCVFFYFIFPEEDFESRFNLLVVPCRFSISCVNFSI